MNESGASKEVILVISSTQSLYIYIYSFNGGHYDANRVTSIGMFSYKDHLLLESFITFKVAVIFENKYSYSNYILLYDILLYFKDGACIWKWSNEFTAESLNLNIFKPY
jgi:hypothetical protein